MGKVLARVPDDAAAGSGARSSFTGRLVLTQLLVVLGVLALSFGAAGWLQRGTVWRQAEEEALRVARVIAADPVVRERVAEQSARAVLDSAALREGPLQAAAEAYRASADLLFVVMTDEHGLRLTHPTPELIGSRVSTDPQALDGHEVVLQERGTLGDSVRAKVPVYSPEVNPATLLPGESAEPEVVGEVSVGLSVKAVSAEAGAALWPLAGVAALALGLAGLAAWWLAHRLRRGTLGLGPEEISTLARNQEAVLHGVAEGVVGLAPDGSVTVINGAARDMLGSEDAAAWPDAVRRAVASGAVGPLRLPVGGRVLVLARRPVALDGRDLGSVLTLRDLTDVEDLGMRLEGVETMAQALRVQRHEFANRLHTLGGLLAAGEVDDASAYLRGITGVAPVGAHAPGLELVADSYLAAFLGAKAVQADECGVSLRVGERSSVTGSVVAAQDATAVLGNLVDNAIRAAADGVGVVGAEPGDAGPGTSSEARAWVEVDLLQDGDTLHLAVVDSGRGVPEGLDVFAEGVTLAQADPSGHGLGVGLPLARRLARRRGGEVWLADAGGASGGTGDSDGAGAVGENAETGERLGAVFCARLPQVMDGGPGLSPDARQQPREEEGRA
ncbi:sensor histidine kinase [Galactobacter valiniphilus]|uniref:sensor histidine kinase n=1 Tax=Galactobacter valiniphilus TaxID=2676122 RepID=UPI0037353A1C